MLAQDESMLFVPLHGQHVFHCACQESLAESAILLSKLSGTTRREALIE